MFKCPVFGDKTLMQEHFTMSKLELDRVQIMERTVVRLWPDPARGRRFYTATEEVLLCPTLIAISTMPMLMS